MNNNINKNCRFYDYGDTCPTAYGAFCGKTSKCISEVNCDECDERFGKYKNVHLIGQRFLEHLHIDDMESEDVDILRDLMIKYNIGIVIKG